MGSTHPAEVQPVAQAAAPEEVHAVASAERQGLADLSGQADAVEDRLEQQQAQLLALLERRRVRKEGQAVAAEERQKAANGGELAQVDEFTDELDTVPSALAAKAADLEKPDPKVAAMEKCEKYHEMLEDAEEKYLPDDYLAAVEEAEALAAELAGIQKCSKERRDAEQFVPLLKAKAIEVEKDIKKRIANKYKSHPWMKMKNFLKTKGVDKNEVNEVLDKYNLWVLAKSKGIPFPDDPAGLSTMSRRSALSMSRRSDR